MTATIRNGRRTIEIAPVTLSSSAGVTLLDSGAEVVPIDPLNLDAQPQPGISIKVSEWTEDTIWLTQGELAEICRLGRESGFLPKEASNA